MTIEYKDSKRITGLAIDKTGYNDIQGYAGGAKSGSAQYGAGGGGGAGAVGNPDTSSGSGAGGIGVVNPITGSTVGQLDSGTTYYLAGGGGGGAHSSGQGTVGAGGKGGGHAGNTGSSIPSGTANTGGGAGGDSVGADSYTGGGIGGSGVVILSYKTSSITDNSTGGSLETGGNIPSGYAIRKFTATGNSSFIITGSGDVQYVVVAGGGGSGSQVGGGGGAGGYRTGTTTLSAGTYTVTVGAGGVACNTASSIRAGNGADSVFNNITSTGGGGGADNDISPYTNGRAGGSGGGGTYRSGATGAGAGTTTVTDIHIKIPTNVQDNSIFIEKDTARRYWFDVSKDTTKDGTNSNITLDTTNEKLGTGCYDFNGSTSRSVTSVKFNGLHDNTGGSISFWMRPRNMSSIHANGDYIFDSMATSAANGTGISIAIKNTSLLRVNFTTSSNGWFTDINSTTQFANNTWYHVVMTFGSNTVKLYINGSQEDTATFSNPNTNASNGNFVIGRHSTDPSSYGYYDGLLDDTGIWNRVITSSEVTSLYNSNTGALASSISTTGFAGYYNYDAVTGGKLENETTTATWNAPSKTPAQIGDLKVHYDATVGVTASSNSVSAWADQSGNGKTLSSVSNPTRVEAGQNGKDYIDFNSSKSMRASGLSEDAPRPFTMVAVINPRNTSDQTIIRWGQSPYLALYQYPVNTYYISGGSDVALSDSTLDGSWNAFFMDFKSNADGGTLQINLDTANAVSGDIGNNGTSGSGGNSQPSTLHVGINGTNNNWYANCRYAEIIIFDKVLTAYEKEQLYGHLKTKWGLP